MKTDMPLLRSADLIKLIKEQDPTGQRVIIFEIVDEDSQEDVVAGGEVSTNNIDSVMKDAYQTSEGDKDVLRITIPLDIGL